MVLVVGSRGDHMVWGLRLRLNIGAFIHRNDADVLFHLSKNGVCPTLFILKWKKEFSHP